MTDTNRKRMYADTSNHAAARKRGITKSVLGLALLSTLVIASCRKDSSKPARMVPSAMTVEEGKVLEARIQHFYARMKTLKGGVAAKGTEISETMPVDSVEFLSEAAYNYYVARNDAHQSDEVVFKFTKPMDTAGKMLETDVANAFWKIKDSLMKVYDVVPYVDKKLTSFDLEVVKAGTEALFSVRAAIATGPVPNDPTTTVNGFKMFDGAPNHAWFFLGATGPGSINGVPYEYGQIDFDTVTKTQILTTLTLGPGARRSLRKLGLENTPGTLFALAANQLWVNIHTDSVVQGQNTPAQSFAFPTPYDSIPGFRNADIPYHYNFFSCACFGFNDVYDSYHAYRDVITTPMMNLYLSRIPYYITSHIPPGQTYYDFHIIYDHYYKDVNADHPHIILPENLPAMAYYYDYIIKYGTITTVGTPKGLSLPSF